MLYNDILISMLHKLLPLFLVSHYSRVKRHYIHLWAVCELLLWKTVAHNLYIILVPCTMNLNVCELCEVGKYGLLRK